MKRTDDDKIKKALNVAHGQAREWRQPEVKLSGIHAYHGSPYKFSKFDINRMGSGEGAQAYGPGMYFAGAEPVAQSYKQSTSDRPGHMYEVAINADPEHFLDWDKAIHRQNAHVTHALEDAYPGLIQSRIEPGKSPTVGSAFPYGIRSQIADVLRRSGIPGIRYLDQGSRDQQSGGTHNYVVFDPNTVDILRDYHLGGLVAAGYHHFKRPAV